MTVGSYHADVVAVQQELWELDLSTGVITANALVENGHTSCAWSV